MNADDLRRQLDARDTDELTGILRDHDDEEWRPEVFPLVEAILQERGVDVAAVKALGPRPKQVVEFEALLSVAQLGSALDANLRRMALVEAGIEAWLSTEHMAGVIPPLGATVGIDVLVRREDAVAARAVLDELDAGAAALPEEPE